MIGSLPAKRCHYYMEGKSCHFTGDSLFLVCSHAHNHVLINMTLSATVFSKGPPVVHEKSFRGAIKEKKKKN